MWEKKKNRRLIILRGTLTCFLSFTSLTVFAAEQSTKQSDPLPTSQKKKEESAPKTKSAKPTPASKPSLTLTPFTPSEKITADKPVSFPNDI